MQDKRRLSGIYRRWTARASHSAHRRWWQTESRVKQQQQHRSSSTLSTVGSGRTCGRLAGRSGRPHHKRRSFACERRPWRRWSRSERHFQTRRRRFLWRRCGRWRMALPSWRCCVELAPGSAPRSCQWGRRDSLASAVDLKRNGPRPESIKSGWKSGIMDENLNWTRIKNFGKSIDNPWW